MMQSNSNNRENGDSEAKETYYNLHGFRRYGILVPRTVPVEAVVKMMAALLSYDMHVKSIDYQLKIYRAEWEEAIASQHVVGPVIRSSLVDELLGDSKIDWLRPEEK